MSSADSSSVDKQFLSNAMASFLQIAAAVLLLFICYRIISPFLTTVVWAMIISVALYPGHTALTERLGGREKLSAIVLVVIGLAVIIVPTWLLAGSTIDGLKSLATSLESGQVQIPPPNDSVKDWPAIGGRVHDIWSAANANLEQTLNQFAPQLQALGQKVVRFAGHSVGTVFQFIFSVIIAGVLLMYAGDGKTVARNIVASLAGKERGEALTEMTIQTIRSVVKGVLGVALIQAALSAVGLIAIGVPAAGLWAGAVLVLAIVQLPPILVLGPIAVWVFSTTDGLPATLFLVYAIVVSVSDGFLKPMLLGRGVNVPMLVILIGAIGGAFSMGILGLFVGSVVLAIAYELFTSWAAPDDESHAEAKPGEAAAES
jgi:predicted PurR-regulated permease PerM